jgi:hypothetical protein
MIVTSVKHKLIGKRHFWMRENPGHPTSRESCIDLSGSRSFCDKKPLQLSVSIQDSSSGSDPFYEAETDPA